MKAVNVLLAIAVSLAIGLLVFEGGLRLLGMGPPATLNDFDARLGWSKKPGVTVTRGTPDGQRVTFALNAHGLRDDADLVPDKPAGVFRAVALGDSFTLGFSVQREDLFVDLLEGWWNDEGRRVQVVNTGTEGWSTDQEVAWLLEHGDEWRPDLVLLFAYENDVYWNGQDAYVGNPKPRFAPDGTLETGELAEPAAGGWLAHTAIGRLLGAGRGEPPPLFEPGGQRALREWGVLLEERPAFMDDPVARTRGALRALKAKADGLGAPAVVVPIPSHSAIDPGYAPTFEARAHLGGVAWSADRPVDLFLALASDVGLASLDPRPFLRQRRETGGQPLYFDKDWHLDPAGNRAFAEFLHGELDRLGLLPPAATPVAAAQALTATELPAAGGLPGWLPWFAGLWAVLGAAYATVYRRVEKPLPAVLKVGALLAVIFVIAVGGGWAVGQLPPRLARGALVLVVLAILGFVAYKLGNRLGTIAELLAAFVGRGHWYLMPLVAVLLTVGSLLVVAASSPLVAPFIYTLF